MVYVWKVTLDIGKEIQTGSGSYNERMFWKCPPELAKQQQSFDANHWQRFKKEAKYKETFFLRLRLGWALLRVLVGK